MENTVMYDFETLLSKKGTKRKHTVPIEVAFFRPRDEKWYHSKLWPLERYETLQQLRDVLGRSEVRVEGSISCIKKIGGIPEHIQKKSLADIETEILRFLGRPMTLVAHNGKSFDDQILRHWFPRIASTVTFKDSIGILRRMSPGLLSYSLPILTRPRRKEIAEYMSRNDMPRQSQHRALYDVVALWKVLSAHGSEAREARDSVDSLTETLSGLKVACDDWEDVPGIGPVNANILRTRWRTKEDYVTEVSKWNLSRTLRVLRRMGVTRHAPLLRLK